MNEKYLILTDDPLKAGKRFVSFDAYCALEAKLEIAREALKNVHNHGSVKRIETLHKYLKNVREKIG